MKPQTRTEDAKNKVNPKTVGGKIDSELEDFKDKRKNVSAKSVEDADMDEDESVDEFEDEDEEEDLDQEE